MEKPDRPAATPYPPPESRQANPTTARTAIHGRASADRGSGRAAERDRAQLVSNGQRPADPCFGAVRLVDAETNFREEVWQCYVNRLPQQ